ncbi:hypothetical protein [Rhodococcus rhodnii]|uniref:Uncharacterized protein n=1 Tax=Rhodococcus rhodnii LMG 5362 TaxID=1273125 RepID=R7WTF6_9NOCA|nr:hypothetical protein [Rhodococcus rhodnii]EOM77414.1 hypothetical protein Rrhod_1220 [Rhodococcus rhodnii LMG 5362]
MTSPGDGKNTPRRDETSGEDAMTRPIRVSGSDAGSRASFEPQPPPQPNPPRSVGDAEPEATRPSTPPDPAAVDTGPLRTDTGSLRRPAREDDGRLMRAYRRVAGLIPSKLFGNRLRTSTAALLVLWVMLYVVNGIFNPPEGDGPTGIQGPGRPITTPPAATSEDPSSPTETPTTTPAPPTTTIAPTSPTGTDEPGQQGNQQSPSITIPPQVTTTTPPGNGGFRIPNPFAPQNEQDTQQNTTGQEGTSQGLGVDGPTSTTAGP